jgi:hypothetical protein
MQRLLVAVCLGLLLPIGFAGSARAQNAQKEYSLTFSVHNDVRGLTVDQLEEVLKDASSLLNASKCDVKFKLDGPIKPFTSGAPKDILDKDDLEAVHREVADVKVVQSIGYCVGQKKQFEGCAWRRDGPKTVIVTKDALLNMRGILFLHEFGHTTGLVHRNEHAALMRCKIAFHHVNINETECSCFRAGPGGCTIPEPDPETVCREEEQ